MVEKMTHQMRISTSEPSLCASSRIWAREASRASEQRSRPRLLSRLLSRAFRASTFHDIPKMESLLAG